MSDEQWNEMGLRYLKSKTRLFATLTAVLGFVNIHIVIYQKYYILLAIRDFLGHFPEYRYFTVIIDAVNESVVLLMLYLLPVTLLFGVFIRNKGIVTFLTLVHVFVEIIIMDIYGFIYGPFFLHITSLILHLFPIVGIAFGLISMYGLDLFEMNPDAPINKITMSVGLIHFSLMFFSFPFTILRLSLISIPGLFLVGAYVRNRELTRNTLSLLSIMDAIGLITPFILLFFMFGFLSVLALIVLVNDTGLGGPLSAVQPQVSTMPRVRSTLGSSEAQAAMTDDVIVSSGYDAVGEDLKLAVKIHNKGKFAIMNVTVNIDIPDGFEFDRGTLPSQKVGNISPDAFQSAIFWLKPLRCIDDEYSGAVLYRDAQNNSHVIKIPPKRIVNVCPMLESTESVEEIFKKLKFGALSRNCASFKFNGSAKTVFALAETRLKGLTPVDRSEQIFDDDTYLGYVCYIGETKYGDRQFAVEIQTTGTEASGVLTLSVFSNDERLLSGFFADIMPNIREHIEVLEEQACPVATCPKCGADIDPMAIDENRVYRCSYCGAVSKVAPWLV